jgi:hypothetical protein
MLAFRWPVRSIAIASSLACSVACGPTTHDSCVASQWSLRIDDPDLGPLCAMAVAPDETIVLLTGGITAALIEVEPDGSGWRRVELSPPVGFDGPWTCGHLAIAPDSERWATMGHFDDRGRVHIGITRVSVEGRSTSTLLQHPDATRWAPSQLAFDGDVLRVGGWWMTGTLPDDSVVSWAFFGVVDRQTAAIEIQQEIRDLAVVYDLLPRAANQLVALVALPTIDYSDGYLLAIDLDPGRVAWQHFLENETANPLGVVTSAIGVDESDVVVGRRSHRTTMIERYDASGTLAWQHEREWPEGIAHHHMAVASRILSLVSVSQSGTPAYATHLEVLGLDGQPICSAESSLPGGSERRVVATRSGDVVLVAEDMRPEQDSPALWVTALSMLEDE